jgi:hypothetical protein
MKKSPLNRIGKKAQETPAQKQIREEWAAFRGKNKKKKGARSKKVWFKDVQHGSMTQLNVFKAFDYLQMAGEINELQAEKEFILNAEGGLQVGLHLVDIFYFDLRKKYYQLYNVKGDYKGSIDALSIWKRKHLLKQYPTINGFQVKYDFYIAEPDGTRVFRNEKELLEHLGQ